LIVFVGRVRVISENRDEYPPYEVDQADLRIIGQVIWFARELV
jgi:phage repressor protein C with HTH and peptisase S24 domain